jgi:hypothetical protein
VLSAASAPQNANALHCLKPTDLGIDHILSIRPVRGPLKNLLGRCKLLNNVKTVRYFAEKPLDRSTLIGLGSGCVRWVYYLNLADLLKLVKTQTCPR